MTLWLTFGLYTYANTLCVYIYIYRSMDSRRYTQTHKDTHTHIYKTTNFLPDLIYSLLFFYFITFVLKNYFVHLFISIVYVCISMGAQMIRSA